jgi:mannose-6-phosphate isomerase-like protein (cupin superfamily)
MKNINPEKSNDSNKEIILLKKGEGRKYNLGAMTAIFKADKEETDNKYSMSEWWLEPRSEGPGAHVHEHIVQTFYVLEGPVSFFVGDKWIDVETGTFIRIPENTMHTFANRTDKKTGFLNFDIPGGFEKDMPGMVAWFENNK